MRPCHRIANLRRVIAVLLLFAGIGAAEAGPWEGKQVTEDGVTRVANPATPMEKDVSISPQELWRLGGESEADEELFGRVENVLADEAGDLYFLDTQLNEIRVFSSDGDYLRTLGREGEGPGEFRNALAHFFLPGGRIGIIQVMPSRIAVIDKEGKGYTDWPLPIEGAGMMLVFDVASRGDRVVLSFNNPAITDAGIDMRQSLVVLDQDGNKVATLKEKSELQARGAIRLGGEQKDDFYRNWVLGADGLVYANPQYGSYEIHVLDLAGGTARIIERDYTALKRDAQEMEDLEEQQREMNERMGMTGGREINPFQRDIIRLVPRDSGELWVLSSRGRVDAPAGSLGFFDVYDGEGRYLRRVKLDADFDPHYDEFSILGKRLFVFKEANAVGESISSGGGGGHMMVIRRGGGAPEDDDREPMPFEIVCYELPH